MKNSKKITPARLSLSKETLRHLDGNTLSGVAGGYPKTVGGQLGSPCDESLGSCPSDAGC